jgi:hypothetical protein
MVLAPTGSASTWLDAFPQQLRSFSLIGGVLADRRDRLRTLLASRLRRWRRRPRWPARLPASSRSAHPVVSFTTGLAQAFGGPAYQALIPSLVDKKDLPNAVALNSIQFNVARVLGPLAFGVTIAAFARWGFTDAQGMAACFALNAASFLIVIWALMSLHVKHIPTTGAGSMRDQMERASPTCGTTAAWSHSSSSRRRRRFSALR